MGLLTGFDIQVCQKPRKIKGFREQMTGIEPASSAWEADILPMNYICIFHIITQKHTLLQVKNWFPYGTEIVNSARCHSLKVSQVITISVPLLFQDSTSLSWQEIF